MATKDSSFGQSGSGGVGPSGGPSSGERDDQVRAVKAALLARIGPYEPVLNYLQTVLVWERPFQCVLLYTFIFLVYSFFVLTSYRLLFLLAAGLILVVCVDTWKSKIWPLIKFRNQEESENESWGLVQPNILSVPELCHHLAEAWVSCSVLTFLLIHYKRNKPGKFCALTCTIFFCLAVFGTYFPGAWIVFSLVLLNLLLPLLEYRRVFHYVGVILEPALQWFDFSDQGYMMSKPIENQFLRKSIYSAAGGDASDSEEELAAFCPKFDDAVVAKELALTDSEHSDAEVSYTDNGTFNLSRGQTPLTEGSEDLDRHSDAEESFARDLQDFPSINPDATLMDDDDDTSIGLPSLGMAGLQSHRDSVMEVEDHLDSDQDDLDEDLSLSSHPVVSRFTSDLTGELAGVIASNMIQAALAGALQPQPPPPQRRRGPPRAASHQSHRKQSSAELDADLDADDFEMLDQSELNQMDPLGGGGSRQGRSQGSSFLSNLLGKPQ